MNKEKLIGVLMVLPLCLIALVMLAIPFIAGGVWAGLVFWGVMAVVFGVITLGVYGMERLGLR